MAQSREELRQELARRRAESAIQEDPPSLLRRTGQAASRTRAAIEREIGRAVMRRGHSERLADLEREEASLLGERELSEDRGDVDRPGERESPFRQSFDERFERNQRELEALRAESSSSRRVVAGAAVGARNVAQRAAASTRSAAQRAAASTRGVFEGNIAAIEGLGQRAGTTAAAAEGAGERAGTAAASESIRPNPRLLAETVEPGDLVNPTSEGNRPPPPDEAVLRREAQRRARVAADRTRPAPAPAAPPGPTDDPLTAGAGPVRTPPSEPVPPDVTLTQARRPGESPEAAAARINAARAEQARARQAASDPVLRAAPGVGPTSEFSRPALGERNRPDVEAEEAARAQRDADAVAQSEALERDRVRTLEADVARAQGDAFKKARNDLPIGAPLGDIRARQDEILKNDPNFQKFRDADAELTRREDLVASERARNDPTVVGPDESPVRKAARGAGAIAGDVVQGTTEGFEGVTPAGETPQTRARPTTRFETVINGAKTLVEEAVDAAGNTTRRYIDKTGNLVTETLNQNGEAIERVVGRFKDKVARAAAATGRYTNEAGVVVNRTVTTAGKILDKYFDKEGNFVTETKDSAGRTVRKFVEKAKKVNKDFRDKFIKENTDFEAGGGRSSLKEAADFVEKAGVDAGEKAARTPDGKPGAREQVGQAFNATVERGRGFLEARREERANRADAIARGEPVPPGALRRAAGAPVRAAAAASRVVGKVAAPLLPFAIGEAVDEYQSRVDEGATPSEALSGMGADAVEGLAELAGEARRDPSGTAAQIVSQLPDTIVDQINRGTFAVLRAQVNNPYYLEDLRGQHPSGVAPAPLRPSVELGPKFSRNDAVDVLRRRVESGEASESERISLRNLERKTFGAAGAISEDRASLSPTLASRMLEAFRRGSAPPATPGQVKLSEGQAQAPSVPPETGAALDSVTPGTAAVRFEGAPLREGGPRAVGAGDQQLDQSTRVTPRPGAGEMITPDGTRVFSREDVLRAGNRLNTVPSTFFTGSPRSQEFDVERFLRTQPHNAYTANIAVGALGLQEALKDREARRQRLGLQARTNAAQVGLNAQSADLEETNRLTTLALDPTKSSDEQQTAIRVLASRAATSTTAAQNIRSILGTQVSALGDPNLIALIAPRLLGGSEQGGYDVLRRWWLEGDATAPISGLFKNWGIGSGKLTDASRTVVLNLGDLKPAQRSALRLIIALDNPPGEPVIRNQR